MNIRELQGKRNKLLSDAQGIMASATVTAEQRSAVDVMLADANVMKSDIERMEACNTQTEVRSVMPPRDNPGANIGEVETRSIEQRKEATNKALRSFIRGEAFEKRDLTVLADGIMVPEGVTTPNVALKSAGYIYDLVKKLSTNTGEPVKAPFIDDVANGFVLNSTSITTTDPSVSGVMISIDDLRRNPILIDNSLIQDTGFDITQYVVDAIQLSYQRSAASMITNGNGSNVQGLIAGISATVATGTAGVIKYADLVALMSDIDPAYAIGSAWSFNQNTLSKVLNIVDGNGRPLFLPFADGGISGFAGSILGFPVKINPYMPAVASGNVPVLFGNFQAGYTFREVKPGVIIKRLSERYAELNRLGVVAFARVGGAVTDAGTHPVQSLTIT